MKHEVCAEADLAVGQQIAAEAGGVKLVLFHLDHGLYATQSTYF